MVMRVGYIGRWAMARRQHVQRTGCGRAAEVTYQRAIGGVFENICDGKAGVWYKRAEQSSKQPVSGGLASKGVE